MSESEIKDKDPHQASSKITQLELVGNNVAGARSYISSSTITELAIYKFRRAGTGIVYRDLMNRGLARHKNQAQDILKYNLRKGVLFTLRDQRPQQYYPTHIKSDIIEKLVKRNTPIHPTGVTFTVLPANSLASPLSLYLHFVAIQTLEGYVLPLLSEAPLFIHNMHFKTKVPPECYEALKLPFHKRNEGKYTQEIIGQTLVQYIIYKSGTVVIQTTCSNNPYRLETEEDRFQIIEFFGQVRAGLIALLCDKHERMIPHALEWQITECDINKDIKVSDLLHLSAIKIQVKHLDHIFRIYIKALGNDTVCRVEENKHPKRSPMEFLYDVFNSKESIQRQLMEITDRLDMLTKITETQNKPTSTPFDERTNNLSITSVLKGGE